MINGIRGVVTNWGQGLRRRVCVREFYRVGILFVAKFYTNLKMGIVTVGEVKVAKNTKNEKKKEKLKGLD